MKHFVMFSRSRVSIDFLPAKAVVYIMAYDRIQAMLPFIEGPSRYLGSEINSIYKNEGAIRLRIALAFPDLYEIGTSHFGIQILYHILNRYPEITAERVFAPAIDMESRLRVLGEPLASLESGRPLNAFDIVGFSLPYELDYTNILTMLDLSGIPFHAADRDDRHPLVIAGGPCTCNPEPVAEWFDAMVVGDGENVIREMTEIWLAWRTDGSGDRHDLLKSWAGIRGVYIPAFYEPWDDKSDVSAARSLSPGVVVERAIVPDLNQAPFPDRPVVPFGRPIQDRLRLEIARGCTRGCRFCQAGMIYRPVRERSGGLLMDLCSRSLLNTGYEDVSLLSLSTGDYSALTPLLGNLMAHHARDHVAISLPSLRAGTLTPEMMTLIRRVRKTGFTIAPEAAAQRLRNVINKNITEEDIVEAVRNAFALGWNVIKLYFMIGLPTETVEDMDAIVRLVNELRRIRGAGKQTKRINVSVNPFVPKPHTPFQWEPMISLKEAKQRLFDLQHRLKMPGVAFKWQDPETSHLEGLLARGGREMNRLLVNAYRRGCRMDGWTDRVRHDLWADALKEEGIDLDSRNTRPRDLKDPLPWDHIHIGVSRVFLETERRKALLGETTGDCRTGDCRNCGVCDVEAIRPRIETTRLPEIGSASFAERPDNERSIVNMSISYTKCGPAAWFGHLELATIFHRALRRARIPIAYSRGFHPLPRMSFDDPLPLGIQSQCEQVRIYVYAGMSPSDVADALNRELPQGIRIIACDCPPSGKRKPRPTQAEYRIRLQGGLFDREKLERFLGAATFPVCRTARSGMVREMDLRQIVLMAELVSADQLLLRLSLEEGKVLRPAEFLASVLGLSEEEIRSAEVMKLAVRAD